MNTLTDLKRLLDQGETMVDGYRTMWKAPFPNQYTINHNLSTVTFDWDDILYLVAPDPSSWHQRDQIGAEKPVSEPPLKGPDVLMEQVMEAYSAPYKPEKPVMMMVPIEQWDALQKFEQRALDAEYLLDVYKGAYKDVGGLEMDDDIILRLRDLKK